MPPMSPARQELYNAIVASAEEGGCAENLKHIVEETHCMLRLSKAYEYVRNFKDMDITRHKTKQGRPLVIRINKENC